MYAAPSPSNFFSRERVSLSHQVRLISGFCGVGRAFYGAARPHPLPQHSGAAGCSPRCLPAAWRACSTLRTRPSFPPPPKRADPITLSHLPQAELAQLGANELGNENLEEQIAACQELTRFAEHFDQRPSIYEVRVTPLPRKRFSVLSFSAHLLKPCDACGSARHISHASRHSPRLTRMCPPASSLLCAPAGRRRQQQQRRHAGARFQQGPRRGGRR